MRNIISIFMHKAIRFPDTACVQRPFRPYFQTREKKRSQDKSVFARSYLCGQNKVQQEDSTLQYNWTEFEDDKLKRILADTIVTVNGRNSYHIQYKVDTFLFNEVPVEELNRRKMGIRRQRR